jgi:hypothetical protein
MVQCACCPCFKGITDDPEWEIMRQAFDLHEGNGVPSTQSLQAKRECRSGLGVGPGDSE